jgi:hypothetical protein
MRGNASGEIPQPVSVTSMRITGKSARSIGGGGDCQQSAAGIASMAFNTKF